MRAPLLIASLAFSNCYWEIQDTSMNTMPTTCGSSCCQYVEKSVITGPSIPSFGYTLAANGNSVASLGFMGAAVSSTLAVYKINDSDNPIQFMEPVTQVKGIAINGTSVFWYDSGSSSKIKCDLLPSKQQPCSTPEWDEPLNADDTTSNHFGQSLLADDSTLIVADPDDGSDKQGQVFSINLTTPDTPISLRTTGESCMNCNWGEAIAMSSDYLAVGKTQGVAFASRSNLTTWTQVPFSGCAFPTIQLDDVPQQSLALADKILLAACGKNGVAIYDLVSNSALAVNWDTALSAALGQSDRLALAADTDVAVIGAPLTASGTGTAWAITIDSADKQVVQQRQLIPGTAVPPSPSYGHSVAVAGSRIFVGDPDANGSQGAIHIFECATGS